MNNLNSEKKNSRVHESILVPLNDKSLVVGSSSPKVVVDKLESIRRIANKIEESKKDQKHDRIRNKEYEELKEIIKNHNHQADKILLPKKILNNREIKHSAKYLNTIENNKHKRQDSHIMVYQGLAGKSQSQRKSHVGEGVLYRVKGDFKYQDSVISKPPLDNNALDSNKQIQMGVVGEPIIKPTMKLSRARNGNNSKNLRLRSMDLNLPKIKGDGVNQDLNDLIPSSNKKLKLPLLANQQSSKVIGISDSKNKLKQNLRYRLQSRNKYKNLSGEYKDIHKSYIAKDDKSLK